MAGVLGGDPRGLEPYIRASAKQHGVDPDTAVRVARSEGLGSFLGDGGKSGGAFQLYTGGGLGNAFQKQTGLSPLDPANERATIDFAMQNAAKGGWGPWNGAKKIGVTGMMGINGQPSAGAAPSNLGVNSPAPSDKQLAAAAPPPGGQPSTVSANNPLASATGIQPPANNNAMHADPGINDALTQAFRPVIPDQINSLLGPAIGQLQGRTPPIAYVQPRQAGPIRS